ncbi:NAD(P)-binding domain-containing protein [Roseisolibacter sp. H3M3-2]|nr:NAD(P)-binding domain-containing protein [Roseisolibacter sp. H3M3-2]
MRRFSWTALAAASFLAAGAAPLPAQERAGAQPLPTVAIIGTGTVGSALGPQLAKLGHPVIYGSREPGREAVRTLVARTGPRGSAATQQDAAARADVIVLAVPAAALEELVTKGLGRTDGKVLVDVSTGAMRKAADGYMELVPGPSNSERVQAWAPRARVVKVAIPGAYVIPQPMVHGVAPTVPIAANDRAAKETVARMIAGIGLDPFDAGPLRFSRSIDEFALLFFVPLQQGRAEGIEMKFLRSSYFPCFWPVRKQFGAPSDSADHATFPATGTTPRPCAAWGGR